jgi:hypothetical protein
VRVTFHNLLREKYDLRIVGRRANCPKCTGSSKLTMAVRDDFAFCHRCRHTIQFRKLRPVPESPEEKAERVRAARFREWCSTVWRLVSDELVRFTMISECAKRTLALLPNEETAWDELADFYHSEAGLMAALDFLSCEKVSRWLEFPITKEKLSAAVDDACARSGESR